MPDPRAVNSHVAFRNSQGADARGTLLKLTRTTLIFEVYNPYSIVQLSEVLHGVQIRRGERVVYRGGAIVNNLVNTGLMLIVSATLLDSWSDLSGILFDSSGVQREVEQFVNDWRSSSQLQPGYQLVVARLRSFLTELNRWMEQIDIALEDDDTKRHGEAYRAIFDDLTTPIVPHLQELFFNFEEEAAAVPEEHVTTHKRLVQNDLHPLMLRAPFVHRSFYKPLGYAGDYEMVNMMLRDPREGPTIYAQLINMLYLSAGPAAAHRNRIDILVDHLRCAATDAARQGVNLKILNIGCGPAMELQRFIRDEPLANHCEFHLLDFNKETLEYTKNKISEALCESAREARVEFIHESVHSLLKRASKQASDDSSTGSYDMVYCAGLFDYLSDKVCSRLLRLFYRWTKPGGVVLTTNVHPDNPIRYAMEHIAEWYLIYRDETHMSALVPEVEDKQVHVDQTGVNVFMEIIKRR